MAVDGFTWTEKQDRALDLLTGDAKHIALFGGSRSGKTFVLIFAIVTRALLAPKSRHAIFRSVFNHLKHSVIFDTFPRVMSLCYPEVPYTLNKSDWFIEFFNGSTIIFGGLDQKERTEKVLGQEYVTIFLNECSQISFDARSKAITRLAQATAVPIRAYYDANPPSQAHWTYRTFVKKLEARSGAALGEPEDYLSFKMNPEDNRQNLSPDYIAQLEALPEKERRRFLRGEFLEQVENALWTLDALDRMRLARHQLPTLSRIVVGVDPSGCDGPEDKRSDEIGIVVAGIDAQNRGYVLEDLSGRYSPNGWAKAVLTAYDRHGADRIVAERNFGGAMVESNIRGERATAPVKMVTASRGKSQRAEPVAGLYEQRRVYHLGVFPDLEDQMTNFSTAGYQGERSPDRADAAVFALTELLLEARGGGLRVI